MLSLADSSPWQVAAYQVIYAYEKLSGVDIVQDNQNTDSGVSSPVASILYPLIATAGMNPQDAQILATGYVAWKQTYSKEVRQTQATVNVTNYGANAYTGGNPGQYFNTGGKA